MENPHSFEIHWFISKEGVITGKITLTDKQQGPPDFTHGGATVPLGQEIEVSGQIAEV